MKTNHNVKVKMLWLLGSLFFTLLGFINIVASISNGIFKWLDVILLLLSLIPLLATKKLVLLFFGLLACFISLYMGYACLLFSMHLKAHTSSIDIITGVALSVSSLLASLSLIYVGLQSSNKKEFSLV